MTESPASACPIDLETVSEAVKRFAGGPPRARMAAANGVLPGLVPRDQVTTRFILTYDADPQVAEAARKGLTELPAILADGVLSDRSTPPPVLAFLARAQTTRTDPDANPDANLEKLLLNPSTPTAVFAEVAAGCSERVAELIADNQARLKAAPDIVRGLVQNPNVLKSTVDRVVDFLVRSGVFLEGISQFEEAFLRLNGEERLAAAADIYIPLEDRDERDWTPAEREAMAENRKLIDDELEDGDSELDRLPLEERLRRLPLPALVAYATKGNGQVRKTLMRHTNRIVALAAVTSPMTQEREIIDAARSRVTHQDAISYIATDKKNNWVRIYTVKLELVKNPKTHLAHSMKLVPFLNLRDQKLVAKDRNVPAAVRTLATKLSKRGR